MLRVHVGMQQAYGNGFNTCCFQVVDDRRQFAQPDRLQHVSHVVHAFAYLMPQITGHERRRFAEGEIEQVGAISPGDLQNITESPGRNQGCFRSPPGK